MAGEQPAFVRLPDDSVNTGKRVRNLAVQTFVDNNDGLGPQLQTVYMQVVAAFDVDADGRPLSNDDLINDAEWKRKVLDELRAIRLGMQIVAVEENVGGSMRGNHAFNGKFDQLELITEAQRLREGEQEE